MEHTDRNHRAIGGESLRELGISCTDECDFNFMAALERACGGECCKGSEDTEGCEEMHDGLGVVQMLILDKLEDVLS